MDNLIFEDCYKYYSGEIQLDDFWVMLYKKWNFPSKEAIRSSFKQERKRRGLPSKKEGITLLPERKLPKIFVWDLEFSPMQVFTFDLWNQNISPDHIISDSFMISWSGKFLNETEFYSDVLTPEEALNKDDSRITKSLWNILNGCNILVGHNIRDFDLKKANVRFLKHGLSPIMPYQIVDTLLVARNNFAFPSNSLAYIGKFLGVKQKIENEGFSLWVKCFNGDEKALKTMLEYNIGDVASTEDAFYKLRPFIKGMNLGVFFDGCEDVCPNCGGKHLIEETKFYFTPAGKFSTVRCSDCGAVSRKKYNELSKEKKKSLLVS